MIQPGLKYTTQEGHAAKVENIAGEWARVAIRLAPRQVVRQLTRVADIEALIGPEQDLDYPSTFSESEHMA